MRWYIGVVVAVASSLSACKKSDACLAAKKSASEEVAEALSGSKREREVLEQAVNAAKLDAVRIPEEEKRYVETLKLFEQSMDCLVHSADCCARLAKMPMPSRVGVSTSGHAVTEVTQEEARTGLGLKKLEELLARDGMGLNSVDPKIVQAWCASVREEIATIRNNAPVAWKSASEAARHRVAEAEARLSVHAKQAAALASWATAVNDAKSVDIPTDLGDTSDGFRRARSAVEQYQKACR